MSNLRKLRAQQNPEQEQTRTHQPFKAYEPGYVHIDVKYLPQMADEDRRSYLFVAIDRATRWVYVQVRKTKKAADAAAFVKALHKACPIRIKTILYNQEIQQSVLQTRTPMEVMKEWHKKKPELFKKIPRNLAGCDIFIVSADDAVF